MELIFGRAWLFLCHESQIAQRGDFVEAAAGCDNVLVGATAFVSLPVFS